MAATVTRAREDRLLTNVSRRHQVEGLVADQILTKISNVKKSTGKIGKYGNEHLRIVHDLVGGMTEYPVVTADTKSSDRYIIEKHGLAAVLSEEEIDNEEQPFAARQDKTMDVTDRLLLGREYALASTLTDTAVLTHNVTLSGTDQFNDYDNSHPLEIFRAARASIYEKTGKDVRMPGGFALMTWDVENALSYHPELLDLYKYTSSVGAGLNLEQLKKALKVDRLVLAWSQYDSSKEGQTQNIIPTWGKNMIFGFAPLTGRKKMTTLGFCVRKSDSVRVFRNNLISPPKSELIQVDHSYDDLLVNSADGTKGAGYLIKDATA